MKIRQAVISAMHPSERKRLIEEEQDTSGIAADDRLFDHLRAQFKEPLFKSTRISGEFPQLIVEVPDSWPHIVLAPLYDVHKGHARHDAILFAKHLTWIKREPYVLTFNGGDYIENASKLSVGAGVYEQDFSPNNQLVRAAKDLAQIRHKLMFSLPGNHEDRAGILGVDIAQWLAWMVDVPYFPDFCFCTIKWRKNNFRLLAHHGSGAAGTPGGQRNSARKAVPWAKVFDIYWSGHLHSPLADILYQTDFDAEGKVVERSGLVLISPSYLRYFGTYAAKKQYSPGVRGLAACVLQEDGRIDTSIHARGVRL